MQFIWVANTHSRYLGSTQRNTLNCNPNWVLPNVYYALPPIWTARETLYYSVTHTKLCVLRKPNLKTVIMCAPQKEQLGIVITRVFMWVSACVFFCLQGISRMRFWCQPNLVRMGNGLPYRSDWFWHWSFGCGSRITFPLFIASRQRTFYETFRPRAVFLALRNAGLCLPVEDTLKPLLWLNISSCSRRTMCSYMCVCGYEPFSSKTNKQAV